MSARAGSSAHETIKVTGEQATHDNAERHQDVREGEDSKTNLGLKEEDEGADPADGPIVGSALLLHKDVLDDGRLGDADAVELLRKVRSNDRSRRSAGLNGRSPRIPSGARALAYLSMPDAGSDAVGVVEVGRAALLEIPSRQVLLLVRERRRVGDSHLRVGESPSRGYVKEDG